MYDINIVYFSQMYKLYIIKLLFKDYWFQQTMLSSSDIFYIFFKMSVSCLECFDELLAAFKVDTRKEDTNPCEQGHTE